VMFDNTPSAIRNGLRITTTTPTLMFAWPEAAAAAGVVDILIY